MGKNNLIKISCFNQEIGKLGWDENLKQSYFQYNSEFLKSRKFESLFPKTGLIRRIPQTQIFRRYNNDTFKGLPPQIADSLPDVFGNLIFKKWLESQRKGIYEINILEQLTYVGKRGMGALEFEPIQEIKNKVEINLNEIIEVLQKVIYQKRNVHEKELNSESLFNIFKIGTSAGGARPKILVSENKKTQELIPGDLEVSDNFNHYLVKLALEENSSYQGELIEYSYYKVATQVGIRMMPSKLIDDKHFATERFDRENGKKKHILTSTGITGWNFRETENSSYENLFDLAIFLKVPHKEIEELFRRMVFNIIFCNYDDHLKNHSFIYDEINDSWNLSPAYDITFSVNPLLNFMRVSRALAINNKRNDITKNDVLKIAEKYTIQNPTKIIQEIEDAILIWKSEIKNLNIRKNIITSISNQFKLLS